MNVIGNFTAAARNFTGVINTLTLSIPATFAAVERKTDKSPDYRITWGRAEIGAAWRKTSESGVDYLSVSLDDPSFRHPINASLFKDDGDTYRLIWSRPEAK